MFSTFRTWLARRSAPKSLGERGEDFAARYLKRLGYHIVGRQVDLRVGEFDIVAVDPGSAPSGGWGGVRRGGRSPSPSRTIVFVEVKTRTSNVAGEPAEAIDREREERLTRAALAYLKSHGLLEHAARFDVIALTWPDGSRTPTVEHIRDAFPAAGQGQFFS